MNKKTSALFRAQYAVETLFEVYFIRSVRDGTLLTFCIVQGIMTVMVSVQRLYLKDKIAFWCQNKIHLVYYLHNKHVITPWQGYVSNSRKYI